jgi:hypothetical protein
VRLDDLDVERLDAIAAWEAQEAHEEEERRLVAEDEERKLSRYVDAIARHATPSTDPRVVSEARQAVWDTIETSEVFWDDGEPYLSEEDEQEAEAAARDAARWILLRIARRDVVTHTRRPHREILTTLNGRVRQRGTSRQGRPGRRTRSTASAPARPGGEPPPADRLSRCLHREVAA